MRGDGAPVAPPPLAAALLVTRYHYVLTQGVIVGCALVRCQRHFQRLLFNIHSGYHVFIQQVRRHRKKLAKNAELEFTLGFQKTLVNDVVAHFFVNDVLALVN